jgi:arylsulfatase A-like enzyme
MFLYDALIHVPMIWYVPGLSRPRRTKVLAQGIDIFPTLVDLTGGKPLRDLPGRSLKPVFAGAELSDRDCIFTSAAYGELPRELVETNHLRSASKTPLHTLVEDGSDDPQHRISMLRSHEWKFILNESRAPELYRMGGGWIERENVAERKEFTGTRRDLEKRLGTWWRW